MPLIQALLAIIFALILLGPLGGCRDRGDKTATNDPPLPSSQERNQVRIDAAAATENPEAGAEPIDPRALVIGLDTDMSSSAAEAGEAMRRGAILAIDEINERGGVMGRRLQLVVKDHRGNPGRGVENIEFFAGLPNLAAVLGGLHTPVALAELDAVHEHRIPFLIPWAAGTAVIDNGRKPNFAFRVSVRDEYAGAVITKHALDNGCKKLGLLLERTLWGRSNREAISEALTNYRDASMIIEWMNLGTLDLTEQIKALVDGGAQCVILVSNPLEGQAAIRSMADLPPNKRRPIFSHWGILGAGRKLFSNLEPILDEVELAFLQTFSFFNPRHPERAARVFQMYCDKFDDCTVMRDIFSPTGTAHAYELVHLLALAIRKAGTLERPAIRDALETLRSYQGLIRDYEPPFTAERHDALTASDLQMCRFGRDGSILPVSLAEPGNPKP